MHYRQLLYLHCIMREVNWTHFFQCLDFEVELAFVIGKEGKNIQVSLTVSDILYYCVEIFLNNL